MKFKKITLLALSFLSLGLVGCGGGSNTNSGTTTSSAAEVSTDKVKVTFDYNYEGKPASNVVSVDKGEVVDEPSKPTRDRYEFTGWYSDSNCTSLFDFEYALDSDVTIYAGWKLTTAVVTFDLNYTGSTATTQEVKVGDKVTQPSDPTRDGYLFVNWAKDAAGTTAYDFSAAVNADLTIYANWEAVSGDTVTITYMWNYEGAPDNGVANKSVIKANSKTTAYQADRGETYYLAGWYTDSACTTAFDFTKRVSSSVTLYARWFNKNIFEAEYIDMTGKVGYGYSGNQSGVGMIVKQKSETQNASNGYYVGWMYYKDTTLTFNINAETATTDATLLLRLSCEFYDMTFTSTSYQVKVNDTALSYNDISITDVPSQGTNQWKEFTDFYISTKVSLNQGENTIDLVVNNSDRLGDSGTMYATAPLVDCLKIYTDVNLSWTPLTDNLNGNIS